MADWDHDDNRLGRREREWRGGRDWRGESAREGADAPRRFGAMPPVRDEDRTFGGPQFGYRGRDARTGPGRRDVQRDRDQRPASYEAGPSPYEPGGAGARGYGDGGDSAYGQMASGSSDSGLGGYGGESGGYGQPNLNAQWGQGGYAPLNQGLDYGQDGGRFGPSGYDTGDFGRDPRRGRSDEGPAHHDGHHASYRTWRDTQLASHDRDYGRWRDEQARRYDEDYGSWRTERHSAFSKEFEGWRSGRGGQAGGTSAAPSSDAATPDAPGGAATVNPSGRAYDASATPDASLVHGANPALARIADGDDGKRRPDHDEARDKDEAREADADPFRR